jgi:hypothetical protein
MEVGHGARRRIRAGVVDDVDRDPGPGAKRLNTPAQVRTAAIGDDDDVEVHAAS